MSPRRSVLGAIELRSVERTPPPIVEASTPPGPRSLSPAPIARAARALLKALVWLIPALLFARPRIDPLFLASIFTPALGAAVIAIVTDVVSLQRKDGEDAVSERRIAVALLLTIVLSAAGFGRFEFAALDETIRFVGFAVLLGAYWLRVSAMATNRFFSGVLVVQTERAHAVCDRGPYQIVRHPGNLSAILIALSLPFAIGSWFGLPFALLAALVVFDRTQKEERFLHAQLPGYRAYSERVRFRLFPGVY